MHPHISTASPLPQGLLCLSHFLLPFYLHIRVAKSYRLVGGVLGGGGVNWCAAGERWSAVVTSDWWILWSVLHPSPASCCCFHLTMPSPSVSAAPARSGPLGCSRDGGLSTEQKAGAPITSDGALEKKGGCTMLFYHVQYVCPLTGPTLIYSLKSSGYQDTLTNVSIALEIKSCHCLVTYIFPERKLAI